MDYFTLDKDFWQRKLVEFLKYVGESPGEFIFFLILFMSPMLLASAYLSYKLAQQIQAKEKAEKREERRKKAMHKAKAKKSE